MSQMQADKDHCRNVGGRDENIAEAQHDHGVHVMATRSVNECVTSRIGDADREVEQMINEESRDCHA